MKIQLIDRNQGMCDEWNKVFHECDDVIVYCGDFFSLPTDCVVSPANSFGFMDGGLDYAITLKLGTIVQERLQEVIQEKHMGELLVGQAELIKTSNNEIPYCISAPTMRVPLLLTNTVNVYLASKAIFNILKNNAEAEAQIETVTISGLGTGVGEVSFRTCAKQMKQAYDDIWLGQLQFPKGWQQSQIQHHSLF